MATPNNTKFSSIYLKMQDVKLKAYLLAIYFRWTGPANIRSFHLHVLRKDLECTLAEFVVERQRKTPSGL